MRRVTILLQDALPEAKADEPERAELRQRIETLPIEDVRTVLQFLNAKEKNNDTEEQVMNGQLEF